MLSPLFPIGMLNSFTPTRASGHAARNWLAPLGLLGLGLTALLFATNRSHADEVPLAHQFGFLPPEIYKLDFRTRNLLVRDINGDGKLDVIVVNNLRNRIDVLEQRPDGEVPTPEPTSGINELPNDNRLKHRKIRTTRAVASLEVRDVNGDGRADLVYLSDPPGLYIEYQDAAGNFTETRAIEARDAQTNVWSLDVGDLNGDGRADVAFLGSKSLNICYQDANGRLLEPKRFRLSDSDVSLLRVLDFDGDGREDVIYLTNDEQFPLRLRLQTAEGQLGPERRLAMDPPRGVSYANIDGQPGEEVLAISQLSGRMVAYTLGPPTSTNPAPSSQLLTYPFEKSGTSPQTDLVIGDFDGDGKQDVVVTDADASRFLLYRQLGEEGLGFGVAYSSPLDITQIRAGDINGDGKAELISLSKREKMVGYSNFDGSRLSYPTPLPTVDEPVAIELIPTEGSYRLAYVSKLRNRETRKDAYTLRLLVPKAAEGKLEWTVEEKAETELVLKEEPNQMQWADANGDGIPDVVLFFAINPPVVYLGKKEGGFAAAPESSEGTLKDIRPPTLVFAPLAGGNGDLLVAQNNFVRKVQLDEAGRWRTLDQFNAADTSAKVTGLAVIDIDGDGENELALYDRPSQSILFLKKQDGVYQSWRKLKVGSFGLKGMRVADLNNDGRQDLLLFDPDRMGVSYGGVQEKELIPLASYETDLRLGRLIDMVPGDLNGDGKMDLAVIEAAQHHLEIVTLEDKEFRRATRWKVFDEKTFRRGTPSIEPREVVTGDVNHDGLEDLILLVHDRVLIYLQDDGHDTASQTAAAQ